MNDIYIDESCHLEHDHIPVMAIGYMAVPNNQSESIRQEIQQLKLKHHTPVELKWNKFSKSRMPFYFDLIDLFFDTSLSFRCILVKYKERLKHDDFNQGSHDNFYYKLIYFLIKVMDQNSTCRVFLDIKDTRGKEKLTKIDEILKHHYNQNSPFIHFQHIRSEHNVFIQLADFFVGAICYRSRVSLGSLKPNTNKMKVIEYLESKSGFTLNEGTPPWEVKFNIFDHQPKK